MKVTKNFPFFMLTDYDEYYNDIFDELCYILFFEFCFSSFLFWFCFLIVYSRSKEIKIKDRKKPNRADEGSVFTQN